MGQVLRRLQEYEEEAYRPPSLPNRQARRARRTSTKRCMDLNDLPPEIGLLVLSNLNATDLCLAGCVWDNLAKDDMLWQGLCRSNYGYVSAYRYRDQPGFCFRRLYLQLDEATLTFNADPELGYEYLIRNELLEDSPVEIARFLHYAKNLDKEKKGEFLDGRRDILCKLIELQNYENQFLPNALRNFFFETRPPNERSNYLHELVDVFSTRFCACNPALGLNKDTVYIVCFSLIMLSVDLSSPHIKNKMSKREFIRNTRQATAGVNDDFAGHLYDNIYLVGHVAPKA